MNDLITPNEAHVITGVMGFVKAKDIESTWAHEPSIVCFKCKAIVGQNTVGRAKEPSLGFSYGLVRK